MNKNLKAKNPVSRTIKKPTVKLLGKPMDSGRTSRKSTPPSAQNKSKASAKDLSLVAESMDMSHEELDTASIAQSTNTIKTQILDSLQVFKNVNSEYINSNFELQKEVDDFQKDFFGIRNEVNCLLWESSKSKEGLSKMKNIIKSPKSGGHIMDIDLSSVKESEEEALLDSLKALQDEISLIKEKIENNESQVKKKESMNSELKETVNRLRDSILSAPNTDTNHKNCCEIS